MQKCCGVYENERRVNIFVRYDETSKIIPKRFN